MKPRTYDWLTADLLLIVVALTAFAAVVAYA